MKYLLGTVRVFFIEIKSTECRIQSHRQKRQKDAREVGDRIGNAEHFSSQIICI